MHSRSSTLIFRSALLFALLVLAAVIGYVVPNSGVIVTGVVIGIGFELTRYRYQENALAATAVAFSTMALLWGWFGPYLGDFANTSALLMFLGWGIHCLKNPSPSSRITLPIAGIIALCLSIVVSLQDSYRVLSPLFWGYDNSAHVPALSQVYRHGGFIFSGNLPDLFSFGNYVNGYPPLQSGTWAFAMSIANARITGGYEILNYFGFFLFGTGVLMVILIAKSWITSSPQNRIERLYASVVFLLVALLVTLSQASIVFWTGYPPFIWACLLIVAVLKLTEKSGRIDHRIFLTGLGVVLVTYAYPLLTPVMLVVFIFELCGIRRTDLRLLRESWKLLASFTALGIALILAIILKSLNVPHYLLNAGGIQPFRVSNLLAVLSVIVLILLSRRLIFRAIPITLVALVGSIANFWALAIYSKSRQGLISYYPQKAGYLTLILGFVALGTALNMKSRIRATSPRRIIQVVCSIAAISALWYSVSAAGNPQYMKYGYFSSRQVWDQIRQTPANPARDCFFSAMDITSDINSIDNTQILLFLKDDLMTRWLNGVRGRLNDATYSLSIPVGQGVQSLPEILASWFLQFPTAHLLILAPQPPVGLEKWSDRIEFRQFECKV